MGRGGASREGATIVVVDDEAPLRQALAEHLESLGHHVLTAATAEAALELSHTIVPDLILTDVHMGAMSGVDLCAAIKADPALALTPVVLLTGVFDLSARIAGLAAGADDFFGKPVELPELATRVEALLRTKSLVDQLERAESVIVTLGATIEARDPYTGGHCERLARYGAALGEALGVGPGMVRALRLGGYLHDLGKIAVPDRVLLKPGALEAPEWALMRQHPAVGADLVGGLRTLEEVRPMIRHHHERMDGSGYPDGLAGEAIPLSARIMAVVDVYDALRTSRPYKPAMPHAQVMELLSRETDAGYWDPRVVTAFAALMRETGGRVPGAALGRGPVLLRAQG